MTSQDTDLHEPSTSWAVGHCALTWDRFDGAWRHARLGGAEQPS